MAAPTTEVDVCNMALFAIGQKRVIAALTDQTTEAQACDTFYAQCRDEALQDFAWPFAMRRYDLNVTTEERDEWGFVYTLPPDIVAPRWIGPGVQMPEPDQLIPFVIELADDGVTKVLLTDEEDAILNYTARIEAVGSWSPKFTRAVSWLLAADLALSLALKPDLEQQMRGRYMAAVTSAKTAALNERTAAPARGPSILSARGTTLGRRSTLE